ncbi:histidinol dehydrogenase [Legionella beliardensis]|uniref:Histidinol dehydrogenase n=1 Tax=Legionella beliardensis TaxID=91822 RepID=A0A378I3G6_9GAMM|nr:histidinol dehydrogenase [Legionella beliardensis]STX29310.1 histidinol dehydrogenase [Legionella beliardensis]
MLKIVDWQTLSAKEKQTVLARPKEITSIKDQVSAIIAAVRSQGDQALIDFTQRFDHYDLNNLPIASSAINQAAIAPEAVNAIKTAIATITCYHQATLPEPITVTTSPGLNIQRIYRPIQKVGLYVPGGNNTPLISSLLMQAIPAKIAGCPIRVLCTPADKQGKINPHLLVAAKLCDIETIYPIGGAQAIAAMAYGTESITKVDKIFGPGNAFVTEAKSQVALDADGAAIDMPAGPSEVLVVADSEANPEYVAADLLAQAEHGPDSQVLFLCDDETIATAVQQALAKQFVKLSRQAIIKQSLAHSTIIICPPLEQPALINHYAPEHLIINRQDALNWLPQITAAGTIFVGQWGAETLGDYVTGSNHVLPTNGYARNHSGLSTLDFLKAITVQEINEDGIKKIGNAAVTLAHLEGLDAHANAVAIRLRNLEN